MANLLKFPCLKPKVNIPDLVNATENQEKINIQQQQMMELQKKILERQRIKTEEYFNNESRRV
jgi:hypothetical protein